MKYDVFAAEREREIEWKREGENLAAFMETFDGTFDKFRLSTSANRGVPRVPLQREKIIPVEFTERTWMRRVEETPGVCKENDASPCTRADFFGVVPGG